MAKKKIEIGEIVFHVVSTVLIIAVLIMTVYPFIYMVMLSLSSGGTYGKALLWPSNFSLTAYDLMINKVKFLSGAKISLSRAIFGPLCTLVVIYMGAYVLSFRRVMGHKFFNRFVVFSMYFSAGLLPVYLNISNLNLIGSYWVYILPYLCSAYELILIRTYIQSIPRGLEEAALIDGANDVRIAFSIVLPLCVPVLAAGIPTLMQSEEGRDLVVTPRELDSVIAHGAALLAAAINRALQPRLSIAQLGWLTN